jgi:hypothetical protein
MVPIAKRGRGKEKDIAPEAELDAYLVGTVLNESQGDGSKRRGFFPNHMSAQVPETALALVFYARRSCCGCRLNREFGHWRIRAGVKTDVLI